MADTPSHIGWLCNLIAVTDSIDSAQSIEQLTKIANRIKNDELLSDANKDLIRRIWLAKAQQVKEASQ